jgi:hypothetical protein
MTLGYNGALTVCFEGRVPNHPFGDKEANRIGVQILRRAVAAAEAEGAARL